MSLALNEIEIHDGITFDFYTGLPHISACYTGVYFKLPVEDLRTWQFLLEDNYCSTHVHVYIWRSHDHFHSQCNAQTMTLQSGYWRS